MFDVLDDGAVVEEGIQRDPTSALIARTYAMEVGDKWGHIPEDPKAFSARAPPKARRRFAPGASTRPAA